MKNYLLLLIVLLVSCRKQSVEVFSTINLRDTTLTLEYKNNDDKKIVINKIVSLYSNTKSTNPEYKNSIEKVNLHERAIWLEDIYPYTQEYNEMMKDNFDYAYRGFPNFRDSVPDYLKSVLVMQDPITIIEKKSITTKKYKIQDYESNDKVFKLKITDNLLPDRFDSNDIFLYKGDVLMHPVKILK